MILMNLNSMPDAHDAAKTQAGEFAQELALVEQSLAAMLIDLQAPFSQLVTGHLQHSLPLTRGAIVLTCGLSAADTIELRQQRVDLAAAQEMLFLALRIHMRLVGQGAATDDLNRSILGSTILAGDFCFSRSAELAVRTGNATVVEIFAETLKRVSEGHLRLLFRPDSPPFDELGELFDAGAHAAGVLAGLAPATIGAVRAQSLRLAEVCRQGTHDYTLDQQLSERLNAAQIERWRTLLAWLAASST